MRNAIIVHGMPSEREYKDPSAPAPSNNWWFPWLQRQLLLQGTLAQTPEMPVPYSPSYEDWKNVFEQFDINEKTIMVGHSLGGGFLVRWLSETEKKVGEVVLVAPWLDPNKQLQTSFFNFSINGEMASKTKSLTVFISDDDDQEELTSVATLKEKVEGLKVRNFTGRGHFLSKDLPELLEVLTN